METPKLESIEQICGTPFVRVYVAGFSLPNGKHKDYDIVSRRIIGSLGEEATDAVTMFVLSPDGEKMLVQEEFRYPVNGMVLDVPAGLIDNDEEPEQTAMRELYEETGYLNAEIVRMLPPSYSSVGLTTERVCPIVMRLTDYEKRECDGNYDEFIVPRWIDKQQALEILETKTNTAGRAQLALWLFASGVLA